MDPKTRRLTFRAACLALCLIPTCLVLVWLVDRHSSRQILACQDRIARRLGLSVHIDRLVYPRPGVTELQGLVLSEPESGLIMVRAPTVRMAHRDGKLVLVASRPRIRRDQTARLVRHLHDRLIRHQPQDLVAIHLVAAVVGSSDQSGSGQLNDVQLLIEPSSETTVVSLQFRVPGQNMLEPCQLRLVRDHHQQPAVSEFQLHNHSAPLLLRALSPYFPALNRLGHQASFQGSVSGWLTESGWSAEVSGRIFSVELGRLIEPLSNHTLSGSSEIVLDLVSLHNGRLTRANGSVVSQNGLIGPSLLNAATDWLQMSPGLPAGRDRPVAYSRMAFGFALDATGLTVRGQCPGGSRGTVVLDRRGALLTEPRYQPQPAARLVQMLVPAGDQQVPASRESEILLRLLPIPSAVQQAKTVGPRIPANQ